MRISCAVERIYARRLARSHLDAPAPADRVLDVVRDVLGVHAQLMTAAELSLSARVEGVTRATVPHLLWETRQLVKGNTVRGTLHLQTPEDFALWKSVYEPAVAHRPVAQVAGADARRGRVAARIGTRRARRAAH